ncbi:MAG: hypothetical protein ACXVY8_06070, partial [Gaiellaceae bacterium]
MSTPSLAAASLLGGYAVVRATGMRALGGLVFVTGTACCAREWRRRRGTAMAAALTGVQAGAFVASHRLARRVGAWPGVVIAAAASAAAATAAQ